MDRASNLLLEIGTEEIPAGFLPRALDDLARLARERLGESQLSFKETVTLGTPRRLTLVVRGMSSRQPDREERLLGPPARIAFDEDGQPTKAALGFARTNGVSVEELVVRKTDKGDYLAIERIVEGKDALDILPDLLPRLICSIPFAKTMRWDDKDIRFARPIRWLVALYGERVIEFSLAGVSTGRHSRGHRFMSPGPVEVPSSLEGYRGALRDAHVIVDVDARRARLVEQARAAAMEAGGKLLDDEELVEINANLAEFPSAVCGSFDTDFLRLPRAVLVTCMREHQKYFAVVDKDGRLKANFVAINNTLSPRPELVRTGHERVLRARLSDAAFFFEEDTRRPLEAFVPELAGMVFHDRLGTLLDKTMRIKTLATYLAAQAAPDLSKVLERAAWLCKADLLTEMVGEFPTLQGIMGREYAILSGEPEAVAMAIGEQYMPVRSGGSLPKTLQGALLGIADRIDTICSMFAIGLRPSGTQDPFGLRRMALGILHIVLEKGLSISMKSLIQEAISGLSDLLPEISADLSDAILDFFKRRFVNAMASKGVEPDVVDAAVRAGLDDMLDCAMRVEALKAVRRRPEFEPLSIAFKRVMNILKGFKGGSVDKDLFDVIEEKALYDAYVSVKAELGPLLRRDGGKRMPTADDYEKALILMLSLKPEIDRFFDNVMVMAEDPQVRENRLSLLWHIARLFLKVGDLSAIVVAG